MRTTLTIDDRLLEELKRTAQATGKPFKQVVNEALRTGLSANTARPARPYELAPTSMGRPAADFDPVKARHVADRLEDQAIADKLRQRK
jgi:hypothetical protein